MNLAMKSLLLMALGVMLLGSCNTTIGMGRDLRILGEQMETSSANRKGGGQAQGTHQAPVY
jgi:predicted small secreted protein